MKRIRFIGGPWHIRALFEVNALVLQLYVAHPSKLATRGTSGGSEWAR